jgi:hypothetical protein
VNLATSGLKRPLKQLPGLGSMLVLARLVRADPAGARRQRTFRGCFLLNSMRKSGTHYVMSLLANYLWFEFLGGEERLDYLRMKQLIWSRGAPAAELAELREATGYGAWVGEHENALIRLNNARAILHVYRNPLDALVSRWFYTYVNRADGDALVTLAEAIEREVPAFAWHYGAVRAISGRPNLRRIAFEDVVRRPEEVLEQVLRFAAIPVRVDGIHRALAASTVEQVRADERRHGLEQGNLVGRNMTASFIRNGRVGEWKALLGPDHVARIERILRGYRISLDEFVLE